jgi:threonine synthase
MTTVPDRNIHCVAIDGTFDDCQDLVKASFNTPEFRDKVHLGAVNSINWCRVLAQTTYYYWSYLRLTDRKKFKEVHFSVPTGNFGDILAGFYSKQMGLPVGKLIVATNENDILHRFFTKGEYHREQIAKSISPSMDICVSSNFERYLFHLAGNDAAKLASWMKDFEATHTLTITGALLRQAQQDFDSARADTNMTLQTIKEYSDKYDYILCPHSAVGVNAIHQLSLVSEATVCLATAHWAKFPVAVSRAVDSLPPPPFELAALDKLPTRRTELPNDLEEVQGFVEECVFERKKKMQTALMVAAAVAITAVVMQLMKRRK